MKNRKLERAFVTGASGFIGSSLVTYLANQNVEVHCLFHRSPILNDIHPNIKVVHGDLFNFNWRVLEEIRPDSIFHFGRETGDSKKTRKLAAERNAAANLRLLNWLNDQEDAPLLIFGSGTLVYGNRGNDWVNEWSDLDPISFQREYFKAEESVLEHQRSKRSPVIVVRPPWIYGSGSWFKWFYLQHMRDKGHIPLYGEGLNQMSLIHLDDCAGLIHFLALSGEAGATYNITGHEPMHQVEFVRHLQDIVHLPIKKYSVPRLRLRLSKAAYEALTFSLRSNSIHELMNDYEYKFSEIKDGLKDVIGQLHYR